MDVIERAAFVSVGRACGFGALAVLTFMVGLSFDPALSARLGSILSLTITGILAYRGGSALARPYKRTETWLMLADTERPEAKVAQTVIGNALRDAYFWYARYCAAVAVVLATAAVLLSLAAGHSG